MPRVRVTYLQDFGRALVLDDSMLLVRVSYYKGLLSAINTKQPGYPRSNVNNVHPSENAEVGRFLARIVYIFLFLLLSSIVLCV